MQAGKQKEREEDTTDSALIGLKAPPFDKDCSGSNLTRTIGWSREFASVVNLELDLLATTEFGWAC